MELPFNIVVIGNIGSGKSQFCKRLVGLLPSHRHICLDDFREEVHELHRLTWVERENEAKKRCSAQLANAKDLVIYEATGVSSFFRDCQAILSMKSRPFLVVKIKCGWTTCCRRHNQRPANLLTAPPIYGGKWAKREPIETTIRSIDGDLKGVFADFDIDSESMSPDEMAAYFTKNLTQNAGYQH